MAGRPLVPGNCPGPHGAVGVSSCREPLGVFLHIPAVTSLMLVSPDMVRPFLGNTATSGADDYAEFCLIVERLGQTRGSIRSQAIRRWRPGEHDGIIRYGCRWRLPNPSRDPFGVVEVATPDAEDAATRARIGAASTSLRERVVLLKGMSLVPDAMTVSMSVPSSGVMVLVSASSTPVWVASVFVCDELQRPPVSIIDCFN